MTADASAEVAVLCVHSWLYMLMSVSEIVFSMKQLFFLSACYLHIVINSLLCHFVRKDGFLKADL